MNSVLETLSSWLVRLGLQPDHSSLLAQLLLLVGLLALCALALKITRTVALRMVLAATARSETKWDDELVRAGVFARLAYIVPVVLFRYGVPAVFDDSSEAIQVVATLVPVSFAVIAIAVASALLTALGAILENHPVARRVPIRTFLQVLKGAVFFLGGIAVLSLLLNKSPLVFFSGLGVSAGFMMFVFKEPLMSFFAGIQLSANNMVHRGDWIEMPSQNADGNVIDVGLTTVKVQNWDKTITTIPTYSLVTESFKNWRGMDESGGRRIKRSVSIDMSSVRFCDQELLERFQRIQLLNDYLGRQLEEVHEHNKSTGADTSILVNGRHLTNVGTFRAYLVAYLRQNAKIHQDMTFLVRQLQPTDKGLPIEIYVFSNDQAWANYEAIQADIFDHVLAVLPLFDLRVFQAPTGADMRTISGGVAGD